MGRPINLFNKRLKYANFRSSFCLEILCSMQGGQPKETLFGEIFVCLKK